MCGKHYNLCPDADNQKFAIKPATHGADSILNKAEDQVKKSPPATPAFKKRHRGCSFCILDLETSPIPEFPPDQEVVGVISMEDVIEELLQVLLFMNSVCIVSTTWFPYFSFPFSIVTNNQPNYYFLCVGH